MTRLLRIARNLLIVVIILVPVAYYLVDSYQEDKTMDEEARKQAPGKFAQLTDGTTHYVEYPAGTYGPAGQSPVGPQAPTGVVLIHGGGITGIEVWDKAAAGLADSGRRVLAYDLFGRGYSDRVDEEYTSDLMERQLEEVLAHVSFPDTFDIVCMSMGAMVAVDYAAKHPDKVRKIVMLDPYATGDARPSKVLSIPGLSTLLMTFYWYPRAVENQRKEFVNQPLFDTYSERLRYFMSFEGYKRMNYSTWMDMLPYSKMDVLAQLPPDKVLIIYGDKDPYFSAEIAKSYLEKYPTLKTEVVADVGHMPHMEKPEMVNGLIDGFLQ